MERNMNRTPTLAERLGEDASARLLIVHADDTGMCHDANLAALEAMSFGLVKTGSVMVPCPWFPEIAAACRENPALDFGVHLTLTSEWRHYRWKPVLPATDVPGLLDDAGFLWRDTQSLIAHATPDEVARECRAQIERALAFGMRPTHLDSHMGGNFVQPEFFRAYCDLAREYGIPAMIPAPTPDALEKARQGGAPIAEMMVALSENAELPMLDSLVLGVKSTEFEPRKAEYHAAIRNLEPGVRQILVHLGLGSDELRGITDGWEARHNDFRIFTDPETRALIQREGIRIMGWREIQRVM